jgi:hypothetical protein
VIYALALSLLVAPVPADTGRLAEARIRVSLAGDTARVEASYRLVGGDQPVRFTAPRLGGQSVALEPPAALVARPGLWRVDVAAVASGRGRVDLTYRVDGRADRIPLFVPDVPADPEASSITILVRGAPADLDPDAAFPRLLSSGRGLLVARPSQLPDVLHLPARAGRYVERLADVGAVFLVLLGLAGWAALGWRARRRSAAAARAADGSGAAGPSPAGSAEEGEAGP